MLCILLPSSLGPKLLQIVFVCLYKQGGTHSVCIGAAGMTLGDSPPNTPPSKSASEDAAMFLQTLTAGGNKSMSGKPTQKSYSCTSVTGWAQRWIDLPLAKA